MLEDNEQTVFSILKTSESLENGDITPRTSVPPAEADPRFFDKVLDDVSKTVQKEKIQEEYKKVSRCKINCKKVQVPSVLAGESLSSAYTALEELGIFLPYVVRSFAKSERLSWIFVWTTHGS